MYSQKRFGEMIGRFVSGGLDFTTLIEILLELVMDEEARKQGKRLKRVYGARAAYRNGYRMRKLKTPFGELTLHVPEFRYHSFKTCVFQPYARMSQVLEDLIRKAYLEGISTRSVKSVINSLGVRGLSSSTVSRICARMDERIAEFLNRDILDLINYMWIDETFFPVRTNGRYMQRPLFIALGASVTGELQILGAKLAMEENEESWKQFFSELQNRGLRGVEMVVTDLRTGIRDAAASTFGGASLQVCNFHLLRRAVGLMPKSQIPEIKKESSQFLHAGEAGYNSLVKKLEELGCLESVRLLERNKISALGYRSFPWDHWKSIYTNNPLENINSQLKRRINKIGAFPSEESAMRMVGMLLMKIEKEHFTGKKRFSFEDSSFEEIVTFEGCMSSHSHTFAELS